MKFILENGEQLNITWWQARKLLKDSMIYDSKDGYYHCEEGMTLRDVEKYLIDGIRPRIHS